MGMFTQSWASDGPSGSVTSEAPDGSSVLHSVNCTCGLCQRERDDFYHERNLLNGAECNCASCQLKDRLAAMVDEDRASATQEPSDPLVDEMRNIGRTTPCCNEARVLLDMAIKAQQGAHDLPAIFNVKLQIPEAK